ncbi:MAG: DUF805 domain-containing protein [Candidatus Nanopelagicales bacterium]|jgi:uncharacterized membrane protein YhaH (DUF805 family)|nr:DUF805 domain-containing protein [Candidatus Nanopelagicales bacterium]
MSFGQSISHVLKNLTNFEGRASRSEFWWWYLFIVIINIIFGGIVSTISGNGMGTATTIIVWVISMILFLATLSVAIRRLHDTGRSGWWALLYLVCCVGQIILIIFWASPSQPGPNQHGDGPATAA